jgi:hypothetical protein
MKIRLTVRFIAAPRTCPNNDTGSGKLLLERVTATGCQEAWDAAPLLRDMTHKAGHNILYTGAELNRLYPVYTISISNQAV